jgi:hypothetical protein
VAAAVLAVLVLWRWVGGPIDARLGPGAFRLNTLYTPTLLLLCAVLARVWLVYRPVLQLNGPIGGCRPLVRLGALSVGIGLVLLLPVIVGILARAASGRMPETDHHWRSTPRGVDVLSYFVPNQNHFWFGDHTRQWLMPPVPDAFPEYVASFSLVAFAIIALGAWLRVLPRVWMAFTAAFALLSLGPFIHVAGTNTFAIGPWALLRYVPIVGMARSPGRFAIVTALGLSVMFGYALRGLLQRTGRWRWAVSAAVAVAMVLELAPVPRHLHSAAIPDVYRIVASAGEESGRLLELPTGIRDGTSSIGNFSPATQYFQTAHRRPVIGGYLSRVGTWRKSRKRRSPVLRALFSLSEGKPVAEPDRQRARDARDEFLRSSCVRYVLVHKPWSPPGLEAFAVDTLRLLQVYGDDEYALYEPLDRPACERPPRKARP